MTILPPDFGDTQPEYHIDLLIRIALRIGWRWQDYEWYDGSIKHLLWKDGIGNPHGDDFMGLDEAGDWIAPWPGFEFPNYPNDIEAAWQLIEILRNKWTKATELTTATNPDFIHPFNDAAFFETLQRHADRRWPWALLYITPEAICRAFLESINNE